MNADAPTRDSLRRLIALRGPITVVLLLLIHTPQAILDDNGYFVTECRVV